MPFFGLGLHILVALFFAIHAMRTGREMYWLMILFAFPLLGSIVYFFAVYLPGSRLHYDIRKATAVAVKSLDPGKELREAEQIYDLTPTAQNQMRLANALLDAGDTNKAVLHYNACLNGPFANDPEICFGAARARLLNGGGEAAIELLQKIRKQNPDFRMEEVSLLLAQSYAREGRIEDARNEFVSTINRSGSFEVLAEYVIWALSIGDVEAATKQYKKIEQTMKHWNKHTRTYNREIVKRLDDAFATVRHS
jgi:hypothetical protein